MNFEQDKVTKDLAKGAGIVFVGTLAMYIIKFFYRILVSRYLGPEGYGLLSIGQMFTEFGYLIALIGLDIGLIRHIAYYKEKNDISRLKGSFWGTIIVSAGLSSFLALLLVLFSKQISLHIFHNIKLSPVLIIFSIAIPFSIFMRIVSQTLHAFKERWYELCVRVLSRDLLGLILTLSVILIGGSLISISLINLAVLLTSGFLGFFLLEKKVYPFLKEKSKSLFEFKERITFALPLFFSGLFIVLMQWLDTFFIGYFRTTSEVGIYNVASPLAASIGIFLSAFSPIFYPIIAGMIAKNQEQEVHKIYGTMIRWIFLLGFPLLCLIILFPNTIIEVLFGKEYLAGSTALIILSIGYFINTAVGLTFETLVCFQKNKIIFWLNAGAVIVNLILNLILIPKYGINGAALALTLAIIIRESCAFFIVKRMIDFKIRLIPYLKIVLATLIATLVPILIILPLIDFWNKIWIIITFLIIFGLCYLLSLFWLRIIIREDYIVLQALEQRMGFKIHLIERFIKK